MFLSLSLKNFKKHALLDVNFTSGLNGVFGANYKGKSTILYALLYALGGASHVPGTRLARRGSDGRFEVRASFIIGEFAYEVVRTKSTANLYFGGSEEPLATGTTAVNEKIEELIGMTVRQWKELHYAKQKQASALLRYSATNLHSLLRRLVGAEELDQIQGRVKRLIDREDGVLLALPVLQHTLDEAKAELAKAVEASEKAKAVLDQVQQEVGELEVYEQQGLKAIQKAQERLTVATEQKGQGETLTERLGAAQRSVDQATAEVERRRTAAEEAASVLAALQQSSDTGAGEKIAFFEKLKLRHAAASRNAEQARSRYDLALAKVDKLKTASASATAAAEALAAEFGDLDTMAQEVSASVDSWLEAKAVARQKVKDLENAVSGAACPTCQRPFEDHDPAKLQGELEAAKEVLKNIERLLETAQATFRELTAKQGRMQAAQRDATAASDSLKQAEAALVDCEGDVNDANDELEGVLGDENDLGLTDEDVTALREQSHQLAVADQNRLRAATEVRDAEATLERASEALGKLKAVPMPDLEALAAEILRLGAQLTRDRATLADLRSQLSTLRASRDAHTLAHGRAVREVERWEAELKQISEVAEKRDKSEKRLARLRHLQKHLKENAEGYMGKAWASFLAQASRICGQCTGGDIQGLSRTEDGAFVFLEDGEEMMLEEASGAQETIIGLAVQLALSTAAPCHLNLLLLDEPTADMDADRSMASLSVMKSLGQQVIFISHRLNDNTLCDNAITL